MTQDQRRIVGILIANGVEVLDFAGPFEVFSDVALPSEDGMTRSLFRVVTIAVNERLVTCTGGLVVMPQATIAGHPPLDILIVPGGSGMRTLSDPNVLEWIGRQGQQTMVTASVCTGAFLLGACGLLDGHRVTTHWQYVEALRRQCPAAEVLADARFVDEGHLVTSAGIAAGIDMSLHIVSRLCGDQVAMATAHEMEYDWHEEIGRH